MIIKWLDKHPMVVYQLVLQRVSTCMLESRSPVRKMRSCDKYMQRTFQTTKRNGCNCNCPENSQRTFSSWILYRCQHLSNWSLQTDLLRQQWQHSLHQQPPWLQLLWRQRQLRRPQQDPTGLQLELVAGAVPLAKAVCWVEGHRLGRPHVGTLADEVGCGCHS